MASEVVSARVAKGAPRQVPCLLLVHARDDAARQFYLAQAEFLESPSDPLHLLLPVKNIVRSLT